MPHILLLGTCDTKLEELLYTRSQILHHPDARVTLIDVGRSPTEDAAITISQSELVSKHAPVGEPPDISRLPRGELNRHMAACATNCVRTLLQQSSPSKPTSTPTGSSVHGIISLGGSGGTSLASAVMREACPLGLPKLMVSTIASGDTGSIVGETDMSLMYSVVDVAGLNSLLRNILTNAAGAIVGMAQSYSRFLSERYNEAQETGMPVTTKKVRVAITMFGVTTPCVDAIRAHLTTASNTSVSIEAYVFHATGHGGKSMEQLLAAGGLDAVMDLTTTEICDHLCGGTMSAGPARLEAAAKAGVPCIVSVGATDMVNFGPKSTVPERYRGRKLLEHNPSVTLMRTSPAECTQVGEFMAEKLRRHAAKPELVQVWLPRGGVSAISEEGGPFEDRDADEALFKAVREGLRGTGVGVVEDERAINDEGFAIDVAKALVRLLEVVGE